MADTNIGPARKIPAPGSFTRNAHPLVSAPLLLTLLVNLAAHSGDVLADLPPLLQGPDFKIEARVSIASPDQGAKHEYRVREYYSNTQQRARIKLKPLADSSLPAGLQYFYGGANRLLRVTGFASVRERPSECGIATQDQLTSDLLGVGWKTTEGLTGADWFEPKSEVPDYLIGIGRLLFLVEANKQRLALQPAKDLFRVRSRLAANYSLDCLQVGPEKTCIKVNAFYLAERPDQPVTQLDGKLPLLIRATLPKGTLITLSIYLTSQVDQLPVDQVSPNFSSVLSRFTFPLASNCSASLLAADLLGEWPAPKVMSFEAKVTDFESDSVRDMFVAHDGYADASRTDSLQESPQPGQPEIYSISISDMGRNRKYNIVQSTSGSPVQCVAARQFGQATRRDPNAVLFPFNQMVEMGRARVRGVASVVFEVTSDNLPALLFPRVNYVDWKGLGQSSDVPVVNLVKPEENGKRYSVVYFFAAEVAANPDTNAPGPRLGGFGRLGPLLRVDVLQLDASRPSTSSMPESRAIKSLFRAEIFNFMWQLGDAPNGDRADELFAVHGKCSSSDNTADTFGQLSIDLAYDAVYQKSAYNSSAAMEMLDTPLVRNKGLVRALSDGLLLSASQIYDLESKVYKSTNEKFVLQATGRISYLRSELFSAKSLGLGYARAMAPVLLIDTFNDCFWEAARRRQQQGPLLFTFCFSLCHIDDQPLLDEESGKVLDSTIFKMGHQPGSEADFCEILLVDKEDDESKYVTRSLWASIYKSLSERVLRIPLIDQRRVDDLAFKVQRVEINNDKWTASGGDGRVISARQEPDSQLLTGLGFSQDWATRVEPPADSGEMDYALCHSVCVSKMTCRSFSLCSTGDQQLECLISELEFRNSTLMDRLAELKSAKLKEIRGVAAQATIQLPADGSSSEDEDQTDTGEGSSSVKRYELRVDKRCRIYNKHALEMFKVPETVQVTMYKERSDLIAVNREECCAQICLNRNVKFFKRAARSRLQVERERESYTGAELEYVANMVKRQKDDLRSWCSSFSYVNLLTASLPPELKPATGKLPSYLSKSALCIVNKYKLSVKKEEPAATVADLTPIKIQARKYDIIYSLFYERQYGAKLRPLWNYRMSSRGDLDDLGHDKMSDMIREGNNQVAIEMNSAESCARACFLQTIGLDPWCKSFGFVSVASTKVATNKSEITTTTRSYCIFNSISLAQARKSPLADRLIAQVNESESFVHYEPRNSHTLEDVVQAKLMLDSAIDNIIGHNTSGTFRFHAFGVTLLLLVSLATGLALAAYLAPRVRQQLSSRRDSSANPTRTFLNGLIGGSSEITHRRFETDMDLPDLLAGREASFQ